MQNLNDSEVGNEATKVATSGNGLPACITCRYWERGPERGKNVGRCLGSTPTIGGNGWGIWPLTKDTDACGAWRNSIVAQLGAKATAKVSTADILKLLCEGCAAVDNIPNQSMTRATLIFQITEDLKLSPTSALSRIKTMARQGIIGMGQEPPATWPKPRSIVDSDHIMVWPIKSPDDVVEGTETNEDRLLRKIRVIAPAGSQGMGVREIWREASELGLSLGTVHRLLGVLFAKGQIERVDKNWRSVGVTVQAAAAVDVEEVD